MQTYPIIRSFVLLLFFLVTQQHLPAQSSSPQRFKGYPRPDTEIDLRKEFATPPKGYGNVPFLWWNGDTLNKERLTDLLDHLDNKSVEGFAVSYIHLAPKVDSLAHQGTYGLYGHTEPGEPAVFSDDWWSIWSWFSGECARRGMGVGMDDYTVGWPGNGYYPDEIYRQPKYQNYAGKLNIQRYTADAGETFELDLPEGLLTLIAVPVDSGQTRDLTPLIKNGKLEFTPDSGRSFIVYSVHTEPDYLLHPDHGKDLVAVYFNRFEEHMTPEQREGMNYFFQDELYFPLTALSWSEDMQKEFLERKGYDITPYLPALKYNLGPITPKVRLDYSDVVMTLAEERYFRPIFEWHNSRGLIYGSDNLGRGLSPLTYLDYFRANSWYTAPGNDAPALGSSFIQTKVSSSIAHLYHRPRTWLEAFHSMGWGSTTEWLTTQIDHHLVAGGNLVCLHGLYYSTHGGWWEWAPPSFFTQMPYWPHMQQWLQYTERMSYLLSQGTHVCDVAVLYPTETLQAYTPEATENYNFSGAEILSKNGIDFDFIDSRSLISAKEGGGKLTLHGESYSTVVLQGIQAIRFDVLEKLLAHYRAGGTIVAVECLPTATDRMGENDPQVEAILREIFGITSDQVETVAAKIQTNKTGGRSSFITTDAHLVSTLKRLNEPDFIPSHKGGKVLHRRIADHDLYMVADVAPGTECFFRAHGKVELWDAFTGEIKPQPITRVTKTGTYVRLQTPANRSALVVFSPGEPTLEQPKPALQIFVPKIDTLPLNNPWEITYLPTLDNRWGDFRLPATNDKIGPEVRDVRSISTKTFDKQRAKVWMNREYDDSLWERSHYGFGNHMELLVDSSSLTPEEFMTKNPNLSKEWKPYAFSWQYGVEGEPGSQGYHGLKARVDNNFLILNEANKMLFRTWFFASESDVYEIIREGVAPHAIYVDGERPKTDLLTLKRGWHQLQILYAHTENAPLKMAQHLYLDPRPRSSVVIVPKTVDPIEPISPYGNIVAMKWFPVPHAEYDPGRGPSKVAYRFTAAPGLYSMEFTLRGKLLNAWVDGSWIPSTTHITADEGGRYKINLPEKKETFSIVALEVETSGGFPGGAMFPDPIRLQCESARLDAGDWSKSESLRYYSGGINYSKTINLTAEQIHRGVTINLGEIASSCEIKVNGESAGIYIQAPFRSDLTPLLKAGENRIEVIVYSTLANHYQDIPTPYKGNPRAGLIGPARLIVGKE